MPILPLCLSPHFHISLPRPLISFRPCDLLLHLQCAERLRHAGCLMNAKMPLMTHRCRFLPTIADVCPFFSFSSHRALFIQCLTCRKPFPFPPQSLAARLSQVVREKEQAVQELREYEEEVEKLQAQRDNLHEHCSQLKGEKETLLRTVIVCESVRRLPRQCAQQGSGCCDIFACTHTRA